MKNNFVIVYDFDGTLTDIVYPNYDVLNQINLNIFDLMKRYQYLEKDINGMVNAFMYGFIKVLEDNHMNLTKDNLCIGAESLKYSQGVEEYFKNMSKMDIKHAVITSGMEEYICNTNIARYLEEIYGSSYYYENGIAKWPKEIIESEDKVKKIYEINKNRGVAKNDCKNMIYIGDGLTDFYAMKFVKENGGTSICVYGDDLTEYRKLLEYNVINEGFKRDYRENSQLYQFIKKKIQSSKVGEN